MLVSILAPKFVNDKPFMEQLVEWRRALEQYRRATSKDVDDATKIAVLTQHAPARMRNAVVQAAARCGENYKMFEAELWNVEVGERNFSSQGSFLPANASNHGQGPAPMEIGAMFSGKCNLCGKVGHKAAECWSAKGKGKAKGKDKSSENRQQKSASKFKE
eukprot:6469613-Amphidinium_carterae.1